MPNPTPAIEASTHKQDEYILVVKRNNLFPHGAWNGFKQVDFENYLKIIHDTKEFLPRSLMEDDPTYKQIIPYLVFKHEDRYFLMQRKKKASEKRLQSKYSFGIGGHIRQEDLSGKTIFDWSQREFDEEVNYQGKLSIEPLGIINDDSNAVGSVHLGFVFLLEGNSDKISVKSELESGTLLTLQECSAFVESMETWSRFVYSYLQKNQAIKF